MGVSPPSFCGNNVRDGGGLSSLPTRGGFEATGKRPKLTPETSDTVEPAKSRAEFDAKASCALATRDTRTAIDGSQRL